ncbi:unnamed protein product [Plutella xylostella]|uniref:(diamondback moth) hypothetical protein n=1 Tax=Plutella xylostella TaxID=51655 RepID=A0A8S4G0W2_PLUXY|nr:unnamed protein product [Plutella xylostella]
MKSLIKKRGSCKAKLTQFKSYLEIINSAQSLSHLQKTELTVRLSKIEEMYTEYDSIQCDLENLSPIPDEQYKERELFEAEYYRAVAAAREVVDSGSAEGVHASSASGSGETVVTGGQSHIKLPIIQLPSFSGRYQEWIEFHDTYLSLIHTNSSIPKINKFHYLRAALKESAALVIHSLEFSAENYEVAWQLLCDRYNNTRLLVNNHIQSLFNIDPIGKESAKNIRHIIDTMNKNLRALKSLKLPTDHWDILIIHLVCSKLDRQTARQWEECRNTLKDLPSIEDFNRFLNNRADLLETLEDVHPVKPQQGTAFTHTHSRPQTQHDRRSSEGSFPKYNKSFIVNNNNYNTCPLCKNHHPLYQCFRFKSLTIEARINKVNQLNLCQNCLRPGHDVKKCRLSPCKYCSQRHNTLLHKNNSQVSNNTDQVQVPTPAANSSVVLSAAHQEHEEPCSSQTDQTFDTNIALSATQNNHVLLCTALIFITDHSGKKHKIRVLLDNGSTSCFITENLCTKLKLKTYSSSGTVEGLNNQTSRVSKRCDVSISSLVGNYSTKSQCFVIPHITQLLPTTHIDKTLLNIPDHIQLADPSFHIPAPIDMLLGAYIFWDVLGANHINLGKNNPSLHETKFGWLISGSIQKIYNKQSNTVHCHFLSDNKVQEQLSRFFELESVSPSHSMSKVERECEEHFIKTTKRDSEGRFIVTIPLKDSPEKLGDSYQQALTRFLSLERRFDRDPNFKNLYSQFMNEYIDMGHMTKNENFNPNTNTTGYFYPHHGILRESSLTTRLRCVFDASMPSSSGLSFNSIQMVGPTVQDDLVSILLRFRQHKIVVSSDIAKMYRMVLVSEEQRNLQQILWRSEPSEPIQIYNLNTVTYGTASAPYLATRCIVQLGKECDDKAVSEAIFKDFYVDDWLSGADSEEELIHICKGVIHKLEEAKFHLRKWRSNSSNILKEIEKINAEYDNSSPDSQHTILNLNKDEFSKTLGLLWNSVEDTLLYTVQIPNQTKINKRSILSIIAQIFDPLGLISPCILQAKTILQKLWALNVSWEETIPSNIQSIWHDILKKLPLLNDIKIPRWISNESPKTIEMHVFCDASVAAYSTCIYLRTVSDTVKVCLVIAKNKVSPLKTMTIPRLELCGALLATRLAKKVLDSLRLNIDKCIFWCDSTIVLGWLKTNTSNLKPFVLNRVSEIQEDTSIYTWRYIPTNLNPADIGSRGLNGAQLRDSSLWWSGPSFLKQSEDTWPSSPTHNTEQELPELKVICHFTVEKSFSDSIRNISSFMKLQHVFAYINRFISICRNKKLPAHLQVSELNSAIILICKVAQAETFPEEYTLLLNKKQLPVKNKLLPLNPFIDENGLIRVGGRLSNSLYDYDTKHPIILHASHHVSKLIFEYYHKLLLHAGPQLLLSNVRHKYWVINGRNLARKVLRSCIKCCRFSGRTIQPIMGNLPKERITAHFPFTNTAVDYAGSILIANRKGRGCTLIKSYICIFVCLSVRAVHLELVTELTKEAFIAALNRFIARRGRPVNIFSDNGTAFVGGCNELGRFLKAYSNEFGSYSSDLSINFKFSPAYSPHFNGLVEGSVKSVKHHLKRVLSAHLTFEEMYTTLTQIEAILNSRPLTPLSSDPSDLVPLTPAHFILGRTLTMLPYPINTEPSTSYLPRHKRVEQMKLHFWNRYYKEYITELQTRQKWRKDGEQLQNGDMVLVKDDRLPPNKWLLGRITNVYPGTDGIARVADILTTSGTIRRAFNRLCLLPMLEQDVPRPGLC